MSATSEELASQAEQLQAAISYFRINREGALARAKSTAATPAPAEDMREAVLAKAPHMKKSKAKPPAKGGGFDIALDDGTDDLDAEFSRRGAA
jgi:methyl-accepting chemotaxis protein